jgi:translation elongation factor EF-Tu-like GTPase
MVRHIEATIRFLSTAEGGRRTPVFSGYRPQFFYNDRDWDAEHEYPDAEAVHPGDTVRAYLRFFRPEAQVNRVQVGMPFAIREGAHTVAVGTVTSVLDLASSVPDA